MSVYEVKSSLIVESVSNESCRSALVFRCDKAPLYLIVSVGRLVGWSVGQVTHPLDDPHVAAYWPTWPCS